MFPPRTPFFQRPTESGNLPVPLDPSPLIGQRTADEHDRDEAVRSPRARARPDRGARDRRRDPVRAAALCRPRLLAADRSRRLDDLVRDGYLVRKRGSGTFVSEPKIAQELTMTSFTEDMRRRGMAPGSRTLELRTTVCRPLAGPDPARLAGGADRRRQAPAARRRRDDGDRDAPRPGVARSGPVRGRSRDAVVLHAARPTATASTSSAARQTIEPTVTNEEESAALGVPLHSPAFLFERTTHSTRRRDRRVRSLALPRRPVPARHRAQPEPPAPLTGQYHSRSLVKLTDRVKSVRLMRLQITTSRSGLDKHGTSVRISRRDQVV